MAAHMLAMNTRCRLDSNSLIVWVIVFVISVVDVIVEGTSLMIVMIEGGGPLVVGGELPPVPVPVPVGNIPLPVPGPTGKIPLGAVPW